MVRCVFNRDVWFTILVQFNLHQFMPTAATEPAEWWHALTAAVPSRDRRKINGLVILTARCIWLERNRRVFEQKISPVATVYNRILHEFTLWARAGLGETSSGIT